MGIVLLLYAVGCVQVVRLSSAAHIKLGVVAGVVALTGNILGVLLSGYLRALITPGVFVIAAVATRAAFAREGDTIPDTDEAERASQAAMALLALALAEVMIALVAGFVWTIAH